MNLSASQAGLLALPLPNLESWASNLVSVCFSFLIWKMEMMVVSISFSFFFLFSKIVFLERGKMKEKKRKKH